MKLKSFANIFESIKAVPYILLVFSMLTVGMYSISIPSTKADDIPVYSNPNDPDPCLADNGYGCAGDIVVTSPAPNSIITTGTMQVTGYATGQTWGYGGCGSVSNGQCSSVNLVAMEPDLNSPVFYQTSPAPAEGPPIEGTFPLTIVYGGQDGYTSYNTNNNPNPNGEWTSGGSASLYTFSFNVDVGSLPPGNYTLNMSTTDYYYPTDLPLLESPIGDP